MSNNPAGEKRDLVLNPQEQAYLQDETRGQIKTYVGPCVINQTGQDRPVVYDYTTRTFRRCTSLEQAVVKVPVASEGDYIVLENPSQNNDKPEEGNVKVAPPLKMGRKVNIPGPAVIALWPGQNATVIQGHHLRSNQYLVVRIYNEEEAKRNWAQAVVKRAAPEATPAKPETPTKPETPPKMIGTQMPPQTGSGAVGSFLSEPETPAKTPTPQPTVAAVTTHADELNLTIGKLLIIKGTEVSFYIPPTGVEVLPDEQGNYIRDALTLERLEYCILIDEDGNKRYERGPQVTFPEPTEQFLKDKEGLRKFRAIELNKIQGLHIKVIAPYTEDNHAYQEGDELFITGNEQAIYFPRVEHSVVMYGDNKKHFATAIPAGEGRYVMDRNTGEIKLEKGPKMLLVDPRSKVQVRRVLSEKQCQMWYPGNTEALQYNNQLRMVMADAPSSRSGFVSEGDVQRAQKKQLLGSHNIGQGLSVPLEGYQVAAQNFMEQTGSAQLADTFTRGTNYTPPRQITLDTKFEGAPSITIWTGYAVLVVDKQGNRRVEQGPKTILLNYDESLEVLELSTGKPKTTDQIYRTVYLRVLGNKVSDIVDVESADHIPVKIKLSLRVNFEGEDPTKWFESDNYVKLLTDHVRSLLKRAVRKTKIEEFDANAVDIIRDTILGRATEGNERPGLKFTENNMRVTDVEVLETKIDDQQIATMLKKAQHDTVTANIQISGLEKNLEVTKRKEQIAVEEAEAKTKTANKKSELAVEEANKKLLVTLAEITNKLKENQEREKAETAAQVVQDVTHKANLARQKEAADQDQAIETAKAELRIRESKEEATITVDRLKAVQAGFSEALLALGNQDTLVKVAQALSVQSFVGGKDVVEVINKVFEKFPPLAGFLQSVQDRMNPAAGGDGDNGPRKRSIPNPQR
jgi:major vault protein